MNRIIFIIAMHCWVHNAQSQDPVFSQFYTSSLYLNPALSGLEKDAVLSLNYRTQWSGVNLPFKTFQLSAIHPIIQRGVTGKHLGGVGGSIFSDEAGPNREFVSQGLSAASSYNFHLNRKGNNLIAAALQLGVIQKRINMDGLQWSSQYSSVLGYDHSLPGENVVSERVIAPLVNAGVIWQFVIDNRFKPVTMFYQGFAVSNLNRPKGFFGDQNEGAALLFKLHGGMMKAFTSGLEVSPNYLIQYQNSLQVNVGASAAYSLSEGISKFSKSVKASLGFWYRMQDSFIITTGIGTGAWNMGFSYDANTSSLQRNFQGANAFEFSFAYRIKVAKDVGRFSSPLL
jgi:type IX secretion system PorP/SprF family membrane protein